MLRSDGSTESHSLGFGDDVMPSGCSDGRPRDVDLAEEHASDRGGNDSSADEDRCWLVRAFKLPLVFKAGSSVPDLSPLDIAHLMPLVTIARSLDFSCWSGISDSSSDSSRLLLFPPSPTIQKSPGMRLDQDGAGLKSVFQCLLTLQLFHAHRLLGSQTLAIVDVLLPILLSLESVLLPLDPVFRRPQIRVEGSLIWDSSSSSSLSSRTSMQLGSLRVQLD
ncbi:hypothetical protein PF008_g14674 [Phytophthora fragariae]|uniref:Uncharacterized protein n=1 Tax=Phytophthora fragariae TaxID=53985 RepID=A0A6G0RGB9_9STRA|nr:hypothetical protein PF008_g14674 [Phytophthora fragariae]